MSLDLVRRHSSVDSEDKTFAVYPNWAKHWSLTKSTTLEKITQPFYILSSTEISLWKSWHKVANRSTSWLVAHPRIFRLFMKWKFDAYVVWPFAKTVLNWIAKELMHKTTSRITKNNQTYIASFCVCKTITIFWKHCSAFT